MLGKRMRKFIACFIAVTVSFLAACLLRFGSITGEEVFAEIHFYHVYVSMLVSFFGVFLFYPIDKPHEGTGGQFRHMRDSILLNVGTVILFTTLTYISHIGMWISRAFVVYFFIVDVILMYVNFRILKKIRNKYVMAHQKKAVVYVSPGNALRSMYNLINYGDLELQVVGIVVVGKNAEKFYRIDYSADGSSFLSEPDISVEEFLRREVVDVAFLSLTQSSIKKVNKIIKMHDMMGIVSLFNLHDFEIGSTDSRMYQVGKIKVIEYAPRIYNGGELFCKRMLDIIGGLIGCVLCLVIGLFVGIAIMIEDGRPIIFSQERVGKNGRYFKMYKFRSMYRDAEARKAELMADNEMSGPMFKIKNDPRITKVGRFIRKTSIDELPQFFNVIKGDMSLVGTRPPTKEEFKQYESHFKRRLSIKPGITGAWQVSGRSDITDFEEVLKLDLYYIDNWSLALDAKIIFQTIGAVFTGRGSE